MSFSSLQNASFFSRRKTKRERKRRREVGFVVIHTSRLERWRREKRSRKARWSGRAILCGIWSWRTTIFVSHTFFRDWIERILNSCTRWTVKRESWSRDRLARVIWRRGLRSKRCRRYRLWKLRGRINRCGRVGGTTKHISAGELLKRINSSSSSGRERRKSVSGVIGRFVRPQNKVI